MSLTVAVQNFVATQKSCANKPWLDACTYDSPKGLVDFSKKFDVIVEKPADVLRDFNEQKLTMMAQPQYSLAEIIQQEHANKFSSPVLWNYMLNGGRIVTDSKNKKRDIKFDENTYKNRFNMFENFKSDSKEYYMFSKLFQRMYGISEDLMDDNVSATRRNHSMAMMLRMMMLSRGGLLDRILVMKEKDRQNFNDFLDNDKNFPDKMGQTFQDNLNTIYDYILKSGDVDNRNKEMVRDLYISVPPVPIDVSLSESANLQQLYRSMNRKYLKRNQINCQDAEITTRIGITRDGKIGEEDVCGNVLYLAMTQAASMTQKLPGYLEKEVPDVTQTMRTATADMLVQTVHLAASAQNIATIPNAFVFAHTNGPQMYNIKVDTKDNGQIDVKINLNEDASNMVPNRANNHQPKHVMDKLDEDGNLFKDMSIVFQSAVRSNENLKLHFRGTMFLQSHKILDTINLTDNMYSFAKTCRDNVVTNALSSITSGAVESSQAIFNFIAMENPGIFIVLSAAAAMVGFPQTMAALAATALPVLNAVTPIAITALNVAIPLAISVFNMTVPILTDVIKYAAPFANKAGQLTITIGRSMFKKFMTNVFPWLMRRIGAKLHLSAGYVRRVIEEKQKQSVVEQIAPVVTMVTNLETFTQTMRIHINRNTDYKSVTDDEHTPRWDRVDIGSYSNNDPNVDWKYVFELNLIATDVNTESSYNSMRQYIDSQKDYLDASSSENRYTSRVIVLHSMIQLSFLRYLLDKFNQVCVLGSVLIHDQDEPKVTVSSKMFVLGSETTVPEGFDYTTDTDAETVAVVVDNTKHMGGCSYSMSMLGLIKRKGINTIFALNQNDFPLVIESNQSKYTSDVKYILKKEDSTFQVLECAEIDDEELQKTIECVRHRMCENPTNDQYMDRKNDYVDEIYDLDDFINAYKISNIDESITDLLPWFDRFATLNDLKDGIRSGCYTSESMMTVMDEDRRSEVQDRIDAAGNPEMFSLPTESRGAGLTDYQMDIYGNMLTTAAVRKFTKYGKKAIKRAYQKTQPLREAAKERVKTATQHAILQGLGYTATALDNVGEFVEEKQHLRFDDFDVVRQALYDEEFAQKCHKTISLDLALLTGTVAPTLMYMASSKIMKLDLANPTGMRMAVSSWSSLTESQVHNLRRFAELNQIELCNTPWLDVECHPIYEITDEFTTNDLVMVHNLSKIGDKFANVVVIESNKIVMQFLQNSVNNVGMFVIALTNTLPRTIDIKEKCNVHKAIAFVSDIDETVSTNTDDNDIIPDSGLFDDIKLVVLLDDQVTVKCLKNVDQYICRESVKILFLGNGTFDIDDLKVKFPNVESIHVAGDDCRLLSKIEFHEFGGEITNRSSMSTNYYALPYVSDFMVANNERTMTKVVTMSSLVRSHALRHAANSTLASIGDEMVSEQYTTFAHVLALSMVNGIGNVVVKRDSCFDIGCMDEHRVFPKYIDLRSEFLHSDELSIQTHNDNKVILFDAYVRFVLENVVPRYNMRAGQEFIANQSQSFSHMNKTLFNIPTV
jgi:hypothetical protein